jgi:hypothetical protein
MALVLADLFAISLFLTQEANKRILCVDLRTKLLYTKNQRGFLCSLLLCATKKSCF